MLRIGAGEEQIETVSQGDKGEPGRSDVKHFLRLASGEVTRPIWLLLFVESPKPEGNMRIN